MGPTKVKTGSSKGSNRRSTRPSSKGSSSKNKSQSSKKEAAKAAKAKVSKPSSSTSSKPRRKTYDEKDLDVPKLNMITPAGVQRPKGKKKGKVFVDDQESMMTILAMVNAEKEGQIESKMMRARQMEEIRLARQREMEARAEEKNKKLEKTKDSLRKGRKITANDQLPSTADTGETTKTKKRVSFG